MNWIVIKSYLIDLSLLMAAFLSEYIVSGTMQLVRSLFEGWNEVLQLTEPSLKWATAFLILTVAFKRFKKTSTKDLSNDK